ncbi:MAG: cysteine desulfurase NifS [Nitrospinota bacterium]|nr:MAG: cysteine desulfurase NifS [Nitrospinota bacterium]
MQRIYLDHNATTPVDEEVLEAMAPFVQKQFGNPSSLHHWGREARRAVEQAREEVALLIGAEDPAEIFFTSGGSEADNLALKGVAFPYWKQGKQIITSQVEHPAVLSTCRLLETYGYRVTYLPVDRYGQVDPADLEAALTPETILVSIMHANNEVGTIQPVAELATLAKEKGVLFHTDAVQSVGKIPVDVKALGVDLLSLSGHKLYAPKGIGALYVRKGTPLWPLISGGHQEGGLRAGTENVAGIVALGKACAIARRVMKQEGERLARLRDRLQEGICTTIPGVSLNGHPTQRLPTTVNLSFHGVEGEALLIHLDLQGVAVSTGSACSSGRLEPSHVLEAMGLTPEESKSAIRFSLGRGNTEEEITSVLDLLPPIVEQLRLTSLLWEEKA